MNKETMRLFLKPVWKKIIILPVLICLINFLIWVCVTWLIPYTEIVEDVIVPNFFPSFLYRSYYIDWVFIDIITLSMAFIVDYIIIGKVYSGIPRKHLVLISLTCAYVSLFILVRVLPPIIFPTAAAEVIYRVILLPHWGHLE